VAHCFNFFQYSHPGIFHWFFLFRDSIEIFFVLSGFLIGNILFKLHQHEGIINYRFLKEFFKRRWFKTIPAYYLVVVLHLIIGYTLWAGLLDGFNFRFFTFTQNLTQSAFYFFPVSYSLAIEEWFYLLLPASLLLLQWIIPSAAFGRNLLTVSLFFIVAFTAIRCYLFFTQLPQLHWDTQVRKALLIRLDVSMYGVLASWVFNAFKKQFLKYQHPAFIAGCLLLVFSHYIRYYHPQSLFSYGLYFTVVPFAFSLWLPLLYQLKIKEGFLRRTITYISLTSYSYYLLHLSPILFLMMHFWPAQTVAESFLEVGVFLCISFTCSHVLYTCVEKPIMDLRERV
jgi:peptidoglycan/LPS O-acetylase OafA/YrhL